MRIVAGEFKGRRIETPKGYDVRPTTEKVKEALFSMLSNLMEDSTCCDLFSGTGNLGLEAISRGAERCIFCDNSGESVRLIRKNIEYCRATDRAVLMPGGFEKCLKKMDEEGLKADIFFLDPPYREGLYERCLELIRELELLKEGGVIVCEHARNDSFPDVFCGFGKYKEKNYGSITLSLYATKSSCSE